MFFTILCPSCSKSLKVRDELVGRSARCPYCRHAITVQRPETAETTLPPVVSSSDPESRARKREAAVPVPGAQGFVGKAPRTPVSSSAFSVTADTDVGVLKHLLVGVLGTAAFYALLWPIAWSDGKQTYLGRLFIGTSTMAQGGWVPVAELFLFFWAIGMLVEKWLKIRRQKRGLLYAVLPMEFGDSITLENLDRFVSHIRGLPPDAVGSFLVTRCLRGLEHFRVRKSAPDTATMLSSQSDIDAGSVDSSYTMFHVFIWAIPILGFLGTVIGVSAAVGSFTGTLDGSSDISVMKNALRGITGGLATAFDTTLVALSMAMILTFPVSALQKNEGDLLGQVDEYTNENLLRRLDDGRAGGAERGIGGNRSEVQRVIETALAAHRAELSSWGESLKVLGTEMVTRIQQGWSDVDARLIAEHGRQAERLAQTETMLNAWSRRLGTIGLEIAGQVREGWNEVNEKLIAEHSRQAGRIGEIDTLVHSARNDLAQMAIESAETRQRASEVMANAASGVQTYATSLERALSGLSDVLERLGEERIVIETRTRPWWKRFIGGHNGSDSRRY